LIAQAYQLSQAFLALVRERRGDELDTWMTEAMQSASEALARFARGLQEDLAAVRAGLPLPWSTGPVAGQITRLQWLKRQGYGRAGFPRLRQRVIQAASEPWWMGDQDLDTTFARKPQRLMACDVD
jgi:transposase